MADPIVIRDAAGTEHEFPAGFDPVKAGEIVRQQTTPPAAPEPRNARGMFPVSSDTTDGPAEASDPSALGQLLEPYAHPQTLTDFARILTLPVDSVRRAYAAALTMAGVRSSGSAVKSAAGAVTRASGRALDTVDPDLVSIASPRAGAALKVAQRTQAVLAKYGTPAPAAAAAEAPVVAEAAAPVARAGPQLVPRPPPATPTPLTSDPTRASGAALPDQKALNDAALAVRRAAYQASQGKPPPVSQIVHAVATAAKDAKLHLTGAETAAGIDLMKRGLSSEDALKAILTQREFLTKMGGGLPTSAAAKAAIKARGYKS